MIKTELRFITKNSVPTGSNRGIQVITGFTATGLPGGGGGVAFTNGPVGGGVINPSFQYYTYGWTGDITGYTPAIYPSLLNNGTLESIPIISGWTWQEGFMFSDSGSTSVLYQDLDDVNIGETYLVDITIRDLPTGETFTVYLAGNTGDTSVLSADGHYVIPIYIATTGNTISGSTLGGGGIGISPSPGAVGGIGGIRVISGNSKYQRVDLYNDEALGITFQNQDDIATQAGSYSKTITLPGTANNNKLFSQLLEESAFFAINDRLSGGTVFLNKKIPAAIFQDTIELLTGYFEVTKVITTNNDTEYEGTFYSNITSISNALGDILVTGNEDTTYDIDLSQYNHDFTMNNIKSSWSGGMYSGSYGYYYPLIDYCNVTGAQANSYRVENFRPSCYVNEIWDKIFYKAGYSYTSKFLNSNIFNSLVIPMGNSRRYTDFLANNTNFNVGLNSNFDYNIAITGSNSTIYQSPYLQIPYDKKSGGPFKDGNNNWSASAHLWPVTGTTGSFNFDVTTMYDFIYTTNNGSPWVRYGAGTFLYTTVRLVKQIGTSTVVVSPSSWGMQSFDLGTATYTSGSVFLHYSKTWDTILNIPCSPGEKYFLQVFYKIENFTARTTGGASNPGTMKCRVTGWDSSQVTFNQFGLTPSVDPTNYYSLGNRVYMNDCLPNMKQIDFLKAICNKFCLIFTEDKANSNNLIIEPYDDFFYSGQTYLDWSHKVDISKEKWIERVPTLLDSDLQFLLKEDSNDALLKAYTESNNKQIFGSKYIKNPYYSNEVNVIQDQFSSSIMDYYGGGITDVVTPKIYATQDVYDGLPTSCDYAPRFLYRNFMTPNSITGVTGTTYYLTPIYITALTGTSIDPSRIWTLNVQATTGTTGTIGYPYAGTFDSPYNPHLNLDYGNAKYYNIPTLMSSGGTNTLTWAYWRNKISQTMNPNSKMLTLYIRLKPSDIANIDFRQRIILFNNLYRLNKILEWSPGGESTKVQLIQDAALDNTAYLTPAVWQNKSVQGGGGGGYYTSQNGVPIGNNNAPPSPLNPLVIQPPVPTYILAEGQNIIPNYNNTVGRYSANVVVGNGNVVNGNGGVIHGNFNQINMDRTVVLNSDNNVVNNSGALLLNSQGNTIDHQNILIVGSSGITTTSDNKTYINQRDADTLSDYTYVDNGISNANKYTDLQISGVTTYVDNNFYNNYTSVVLSGSNSLVIGGSGNLYVQAKGYIYFGDPTKSGCLRLYLSGSNKLAVEYYNGFTWACASPDAC